MLVSCPWQGFGGDGTMQDFKPGDYVEIIDSASRQLCVVSGKYRPESHDYPVSCGTKDFFAPSGASRIRLRKPAADEIKIASETAVALARLPRPGNGPGAKYGTREPKTCLSRREPAAGSPSPEQAKRIFICDAEGEGATSL